MHRQKKQSTPQRRTQKNEEDGSLQFFRRPPEGGVIVHTSCIIYDGGRVAETGHVTRSQLLIGQPWEKGVLALGEGSFDPVKVWYAPGSLRSPGAIKLCALVHTVVCAATADDIVAAHYIIYPYFK